TRKRKNLRKKKNPQEEDDMEVDIEDDENEPELTFPYEEADPLSSQPPDLIQSLKIRVCGRETTHALVKKKGKAKDKYYGKLILDLGSVEEGTDAMENLVRKLGNAEERAECKKLKKELEEARGFMFEERPNEAIDVLVEDEESPSSEPQGSFHYDVTSSLRRGALHKVSMPLSLLSGARHANAGNNASGSGEAKGQVTASIVRECTTAGFMKCNPANFYGTKGAVELRRWFEKIKMTFGISECAKDKKVKFAAAILFNELALMYPGMVEPKSVKIDAYIQGLSDYIKGEVTSSKPTNLNEVVRMAQKLMEQKLERCLLDHFLCVNIVLLVMLINVRSSATSIERLGTKRGHTRNQCLKKVKKEEVREVHGRAYAIKDAKPQGPNVVTGTFLLNNRYASVLFDSGFDRSFMDTRFSFMLDIDPVKIDTSYKVELADGRVVSTNTVLKGCTLNLVNHLFEIDLMPIELGAFNIIIGMDWLVKHDSVIVCCEKVVYIPYRNKTLTVENDKGMSRLKVISCIKARKYIERGCHLFLAHVTEMKPKEKQLEDVLVFCDFLEVFPDDLSRLPPPRQVEFRIDLAPGAACALYHLAPSEMRELSKQL
nr:putative reverse transcriptase domain-containing protein [Tanacetum cinerariifolium]